MLHDDARHVSAASQKSRCGVPCVRFSQCGGRSQMHGVRRGYRSRFEHNAPSIVPIKTRARSIKSSPRFESQIEPNACARSNPQPHTRSSFDANPSSKFGKQHHQCRTKKPRLRSKAGIRRAGGPIEGPAFSSSGERGSNRAQPRHYFVSR
jgi:hypothetical protein